jgi:hypothetical protein
MIYSLKNKLYFLKYIYKVIFLNFIAFIGENTKNMS